MKHKTTKRVTCCFLYIFFAIVVGLLSVFFVLRISHKDVFVEQKQIKEEFKNDSRTIIAKLKENGVLSDNYEVDVKEETQKKLTVPNYTKQTIKFEVTNISFEISMEYSHVKKQKM